jgi:hypothetical protein
MATISFLSTITSFVENKATAECDVAKNKERNLYMQLLDKLDRGIILRVEFDQMKSRYF